MEENDSNVWLDMQERMGLFMDLTQRTLRLFAMQANRSLPFDVESAQAATPMGMMHESGLADVTAMVMKRVSENPLAMWSHQVDLCADLMSLWQHMIMRLWGFSPNAVAEPQKGDKRFRAEGWNYLIFDIIKQSYLITAQHFMNAAEEMDGLSQEDHHRLKFYTRHLVDALSPSNFSMTNPEVLALTSKTYGKNLLLGLNHLLRDLEEGNGKLRISMTDRTAFVLGENIADTHGKVIFQNRMFQLIHYAPTTDKVLARPLLIIPPWINKYYILDLGPDKSFVRWGLEQGHAMFVISWRNPDASMANVSFEDYMKEGVLAALEAVTRQTGAKEINVIGYCLGGTLLSMTLAWMARAYPVKKSPVATATFFTTLLDFAEAGDLSVYIDEQRIQALEKKMDRRGYLDGSEMAASFNMLRANDLIWSFVVNNYLMGKNPIPFDLLYWNADSTRMPARMHSEYLRNMYLHNRLKEPDAIKVSGHGLDLSRIDVPACFISAIEDHIAPWRSTYAGARLLSGPTNFILGGSGHIAGIINPPTAKKYGYWTRDGQLPEDPMQWLEQAQKHEGSWWPAWHAWVIKQDNRQVDSWRPEAGKLPIVENAPGSYVKQRWESEENVSALASRAAA